MIDHS
jgi:hypothetical protein